MLLTHLGLVDYGADLRISQTLGPFGLGLSQQWSACALRLRSALAPFSVPQESPFLSADYKTFAPR